MGNAPQSLFYLMFSSQGVALTHAKSAYLRRKVTSTAIRLYPKYAHEFFLKGMNEKMTKKPKLISSIRAKLVSAVAMLLVAMIMVVSSTYAWFTLSTAPEVTGISTSIGANGALEMAMMNKAGDLAAIGSDVGDSMSATGQTVDAANRTWGNLVDVSDNTIYGLNQIVLLPSQLNAEGNNLQKAMLKTPVYGADGRVTELAENTVFGNYIGTSFMPGNEFGLRGVGVSAGMSERQLAFRNALSAASTAAGSAKNAAAVSLEAQGSTLANIVIKKATGSATYTQVEIASLKQITKDLLGDGTTTGALEYIEKAYMQYILAYAASSAAGTDDASELAWQAVKSAVDADDATLDDVLELVDGVDLPDALDTAITNLQATMTAVQTAQTELNALTGEEITWEQLRTPLNRLADPDAMTVNNMTPAQIQADMGALVSSVTSLGGLTVSMGTGAGVYADIADHCGDYNASITIAEVSYGGVTLNNMKARMTTKSTVGTAYLTSVGNAFTTLSAPAAAGDSQPLSEFYGYILDLAFRTNAPESHLLLQTAATDRIYEDNTNENTQGHGSSMTFASTSTSFSNDDVKKLMKNIRIVFFTPDLTKASGGIILAEARLDVTNATLGADGVTANMYLVDADDNLITTQANAKIQALSQNDATAVSVLVYLDGTSMTNADVAFGNSASVTGTANFQFSSSANLVPMEYANLHTKGESQGNTNTTQYDVTVPTGVTGDAKATANTDYTFTVADGYTLGTVTVGGTAVTPTNNNDGTYTIPADNVTGAIVINVTGSGSGS